MLGAPMWPFSMIVFGIVRCLLVRVAICLPHEVLQLKDLGKVYLAMGGSEEQKTEKKRNRRLKPSDVESINQI